MANSSSLAATTAITTSSSPRTSTAPTFISSRTTTSTTTAESGSRDRNPELTRVDRMRDASRERSINLEHQRQIRRGYIRISGTGSKPLHGGTPPTQHDRCGAANRATTDYQQQVTTPPRSQASKPSSAHRAPTPEVLIKGGVG